MNWVTVNLDLVLRLHQVLIDQHGGSHGVRDLGLIESALGRLETGYFDTVFEAGAALMEGLGGNHGFVDGNKRVAFFATDAFLRANGWCLKLESDRQAHQFMIGLFESGQFNKENLTPWIEQHAVAINP